MPKAKINGLSMSFEDTGGSLPAILFSHSFGMIGAMFAPQLEMFRQDYRCITWDERAHGGTRADQPFDFWDSAKDALALLDHLGVQRAAFVGTSQGGFLAMRAALLAPDRVSGLAILGSSAAAEAPEQRAAYMPLHDAFVGGGTSGPPEEVIQIIGQVCLETMPMRSAGRRSGVLGRWTSFRGLSMLSWTVTRFSIGLMRLNPRFLSCTAQQTRHMRRLMQKPLLVMFLISPILSWWKMERTF